MKKLLLFFGILLLLTVGYGQTNIIPTHTGQMSAFTSWSYTDTTQGLASGNYYIIMKSSTASLLSPIMNFSECSNITLDFKARTYGGENAIENTITISISVDNGVTWSVIGTRTPATTTLTAMMQFNLSSYNSSQVIIKFDIDGTSNSIGAGIDDITIKGTCATCYTDIEIESILVDACDGSAEGRNEMFRFSVSGGDLDVSGLTADWPGSNSWKGICQNSTTANIVSEINNTITGGGQILEPPVSDIIPEGSSVMFFTNTNFNYSMFDFSDLNYTLYAIFQCPDNLPGHFANYQSSPSPRTLTLSSAGCDSDIVTYDAHEIYNDDGATVDFTINGVPTYSDTGTCSTVPIFSLPVELLSLSGTRTSESSITLNWSTATETNNNYFEAQKLIGDEYQIIDIINGSGNSNQEINYEYVDNNADVEAQYYRLKQVDYDGNFEYYGPIAVDAPLNYKYNLIIYPNPTDDKINIRLNYKGIIEKITLTTISGKEIPVGFNIKCDGETNITLATLNIENGTYLIKFSFVEGEYIHKDKIIINK